MKPFVSIIIPAYNCESFLEEGLDSVLVQLPDDYELLVVDDGSSDGTLSVLARYDNRKMSGGRIVETQVMERAKSLDHD